jgi:hypothetical protein
MNLKPSTDAVTQDGGRCGHSMKSNSAAVRIAEEVAEVGIEGYNE